MSILLIAALSALYPVCNAEVCPERANDLVWENDKFGMRAYGPGEYHRWSGFDVFNKNTASNVCIRWTRDRGYNHPGVSPNFHQNHGEGMDNYAMGAARGVGGIAMFADGEWKTYADWETSRIVHVGPDYCEFELVYPAFSAAGRMTCRITLRRGERFFRNDVSFERMPSDFVAGPGLDVSPGRGHGGSLVEGEGIVSLYEDPKGENGADGSTMSAAFVAPDEKVEMLTDHLGCRVLGFRGRRNFTYWAGASWSLAGEITTPADWHGHVRAARAARKGPSFDRLSHGLRFNRDGRVAWAFSTLDGKPCVNPLTLPNGTIISAALESDHPWHRGLWFSWKYLNGVNFWETDAGGLSAGEQRIVSGDAQNAGAAATVRMSVEWGPRDEPKRTFLDERREIEFSAPTADGGYAVTWRSRFTARERTVIDRTPPYRRENGDWGGGYAGFSLRLNADFASDAVVTTSCGAKAQPDVIARERSWIDYSNARLGGGIRLETLVAPGRRVFYHWSDRRFTSLSPVFDAPLTLEKGESVELAYRATIHR